jgi:hypothetical protein
MPTRLLIPTIAAAIAGLAGAAAFMLRNRRPIIAAIPVRRYRYIRPAGRREMATSPSTWDRVDEAGDESFPASDPPGGY